MGENAHDQDLDRVPVDWRIVRHGAGTMEVASECAIGHLPCGLPRRASTAGRLDDANMRALRIGPFRKFSARDRVPFRTSLTCVDSRNQGNQDFHQERQW